ncbi:hypothetical protein N7451_012126 [Penicillium sp. IBT 35674x]|nr:hypothetical protein N7451_012126 [Penicillium sp. IBT 35674x]
METVKDAANFILKSIQGEGAETWKQANNNVAQDSDADLSTHASAAKDALVDEKRGETYDTKAYVHTGKASLY